MANTTADKLALLEATKADLKAALAEKGQTVGDVFSTYPAAVRAIETGGGSVTITIGPVGVDEAHITYTDQNGDAQLLSNPSEGQTFDALKGSSCCIVTAGIKAGTNSHNLPSSRMYYSSSVRPLREVLAVMVTLSASGSIDLAPS